MKLAEGEQSGLLLTRRFAIEQGIRQDGTTKIRAIDDASESGLNHCCEPTEKLFCDNIDDLISTAKMMHGQKVEALSFWKADVKAAFRCAISTIQQASNFMPFQS